MPIRKYLTDKTSFGPGTIEKMSKAFEEACIALQVFPGDEKGPRDHCDTHRRSSA
jgi:hypothetical protein